MFNKPSLLILGAGGYGLAVAEAAELSGPTFVHKTPRFCVML